MGVQTCALPISRFLDRLAEVAVALQEDPSARLSWSALLSDGGESAEDGRRFVVVKPVIDFGSLAPLAGVVAAIERAASDLGLTGENGHRLRVTGEPLMLQDELESVKSGIGVVGLIRSEEHTSELQSLMRSSYAGFFLTKKTTANTER